MVIREPLVEIAIEPEDDAVSLLIGKDELVVYGGVDKDQEDKLDVG